MRLIRLVSSLAAIAAAPLASAQWADNFEAYAAGSAIEGQGGWHNWDSINQGNQPFNTVVGTTGGVVPFQGTKMLSAVGDGMNPGAGNVLSDSVHELNGPYNAGDGGFTFTFRQYVPAATVGRTYVIMLNTFTDGGGPYNWSFQCYADATSALIHMDVNAAAGTVVNGDQAVIFDQWVEYKLEIDLANNTARCYYNNVEMWQLTNWSLGVSAAGGVQELAALDVYPGDSDSTAVFYDVFNLAPGIAGVPIGSNYCISVANSTGQIGRIDAYGTPLVSANNVTLTATRLPNAAFMYFITSTTAAQINNPGGSLGNLCVSGAIGRYTGPGQIQNTGGTGSGSLVLNLNQIPTPTGFVVAVAGQTRNFQAWHRDSVGGQARSNFTDATAVTFQ